MCSNGEACLVDTGEKVQVWEAVFLEMSEEKRRAPQEVLIDLPGERCDSRA